MTRNEIMTRLNEIFIDVMDIDEVTLTDETTAADVEEWDSLSHVRLMVAVERAFGLKFSGSEISSLKKIGDLVNLIAKKKTQA
jgi:acyl carrier protein